MDKAEKDAIRAIKESMHDEIRAVLRRVHHAKTYEEARDLMNALNVDVDELPPDIAEEIGEAWNFVFEFPRTEASQSAN